MLLNDLGRDNNLRATFHRGELDELLAPAGAFDILIAERLAEIERSRPSDDEFEILIAALELERPKARGCIGRPTKATESVVAVLYAALELPLPKAIAAQLVGIDRATLYRWEQVGDELSQRLTRARARGALYLHLKALSGGKGSSAALWLLERLFPEEYGRAPRSSAVDRCR